MSLYRRYVFPYVLDHVMHHASLHGPRAQALRHARGEVLEIGFGTGANLPHYPDAIQTLNVVEPEPVLPRRVEQRVRVRGMQIRNHALKGEALPFADATFDTVVSTLTLCSVDDPQQVLAEVFRVLRADGQFLFFEHGLAPDAGIERWQHRLNGVQQVLGGGCNLNRPMRALIAQAGFTFSELEQKYLPGLPKFGAYVSLGRAVKG